MKLWMCCVLLDVTVGLNLGEVTSARIQLARNFTCIFKQASVLMRNSGASHWIVVEENDSVFDYDQLGTIANRDSPYISFAHINFSSLVPTTRILMNELLLTQNVDDFSRRLNFVVVGSPKSINRMFQDVQQLDEEVGRRSLLRHFSRFLVIPTSFTMESVDIVYLRLDNIAILSLYQEQRFQARHTTEGACQADMSVHSLSWQTHGRDWVPLYDLRAPFPNIRYGLNGRNITVAALEFLPYTKREVSKGQIYFSGVCGEILKRLSVIHNFSVVFVEPGDMEWGDELETGNWTGIIGMLQREEVDMCGAPYAVSVGRTRVMTYSYPFMYKHQYGVYRKTVDTEGDWTVLTACFKPEVYICGLITAVCVTFLLLIMEKMSPSTTRAVSGIDIVMLGITVPLHQGYPAQPETTASKILLGFWWMFCIVVTSVYTGNLIAFLTVSRDYVPFRSLEEVAQQTEFSVGTVSGEFIEFQLRTSNNSLYESLWSMVSETRVTRRMSPEDEWRQHVQRMERGQYVLLVDETNVDTLMATRCDVAKIPDEFMPVYSSFTFPKLSPLAALFADELMHMTENGLISTWYTIMKPSPLQCVEETHQEKLQLTLTDLLSGYLACGIGILLAVLCLIGEVIVKIMKKTHFVKTLSRC